MKNDAQDELCTERERGKKILLREKHMESERVRTYESTIRKRGEKREKRREEKKQKDELKVTKSDMNSHSIKRNEKQ